MKFYVDEKQRKKQRRVLRLKIYGGVAAFFVLLIGAGYLIVYSPLFQIKNVLILRTSDVPNINNNFRTSDVQKLEGNLKNFFTNRSKLISFLGPNNILIWRNEDLGGFLKNYPQIAELTIEKDYLNRQIEISVKEREKFGLWCQKKQLTTDNRQPTTDDKQQSNVNGQLSMVNNCWWFDKSGVIFAEAPIMEGELVRKISDSSNRSLKPGDKILEEDMLKNLIKIFEVLEKSDLKVKNLALGDLSLQEITAESPSIPKIYFSLRFDPGFALPAIQLLKEIGLNRIDYIDFRVENRTYYKIK